MIRRNALKHVLAYSFSFALLLTAAISIVHVKTAAAASASEWRAGQIIDDGIFYNGSDMTVEQVQTFLNNKNPTCDTWGTQTSEYGGGTRAQYGTSRGYPPPYICLKDYYENPSTHANNLNGNPITNGSLSAAQIIAGAAQNNGVSVRALLAILQKESPGPLITDTWPFSSQYRNAMGYGCPDTAPCDPQYAGFYNQMNNAAHQFIVYKNNPTSFRHIPQQYNNVYYNPNISACGSSSVFIDTKATAGLYDYTPYQPNQAALNNLYGSGDSCSAYGNRNFWRIFNDWFGSTRMPYAFKSSSSDTVYLYSSGYRYAVPYMGILQDYGISPQSIQTISQASIDAVPMGDSANNISATLGSIVKSPSDSDSDGGAIYFVSAGKRYQIASMNQFADFGLSTNNISYVPLNFILSLPDGGTLSNFVTSPYGSVFQVTGGGKHIILDYASYASLNPSDKISALSYYGADIIPSSIAISSQPFILKFSNSSSVYLFDNGHYYLYPTYDAYRCWGLDSISAHIPSYALPHDAYVSPIVSGGSLSCLVSISGMTYVMSNGSKFSIPSSYGAGQGLSENSDITQAANLIPTNQASLNQYIKGSASAGVWYIQNGVLRSVPTYRDFQYLGLNSVSVTTVDQSTLSSFTAAGLKLGTGSLVKSSTDSAVYGISGNVRIPYTSSAFLSHGNAWADIASYDPSALSDYTINGSMGLYLYNPSSQTAYLADSLGCFTISSTMLTAFGQSSASLSADPATNLSASRGFNSGSCASASVYVKQTGNALVYKLINGSKSPITTYAKLQSDSGQSNPYIVTLSNSTLDTFPLGSAL